uniref:Uncharacterized protein n=1 Tax=Panagrolaimus sp. JU765 TaxID=591449 RepID=A0AC34R8B9_9BILA
MISANLLKNVVQKSYYISSIRTISTSQILCRRRLAINKQFSPILTVLDSHDLNLIEEDFKQVRSTINSNAKRSAIDFSNRPITGETFTDSSRRTGMVGIKIGMMPQWCTNRGERVLCTAIHFPSNEVISVVDPETWYKTSDIGKRKAYTRYGPMYK